MRVTKRGLGQTGTEYTLLLSVVVLGVVYAAYSFVRPFENGVNELGRDVRDILMGQAMGGVGRPGSAANGTIPGTAPAPNTAGPGPSTGTGTGNTRDIANSDLEAPIPKEQVKEMQEIKRMTGAPIETNTRLPGSSGDIDGHSG